MMSNNKKMYVGWLLAVLLSFSFAQVQGQEAGDSSKGTGKIIYLDLLVGVLFTKELKDLPSGIEFKGDFKSVTKAKWDPNNGILILTPNKTGVATMNIVDSSNKIIQEIRLKVTESKLSSVAKEVTSLLGGIDGISVKIVNNKVIVDGEVLLPVDMNRINAVLKQFPGQASSIVTMSPLALKKMAEIIEREVNNPEIHCKAANESFILEGWAADKNEQQRAEIIAKTFVQEQFVGPDPDAGARLKPNVAKVINLINIKESKAAEPSKTVKLNVHYVELQKDYEKSFRFQWMPDLSDGTKLAFESGGDRGPGGILSTITGTITNLLPKLNWAKQHGFARVLQSSSIMVMDGQKGDIRSTVRVPYLVAGPQGTQSTNFEEAGLITTVTPKIMGARSDNVRLQMEFAVKSLLSYTPKGPIVSNNSVNTVVVVRSSQSAAVGGLVTATSGTNFNKLPPDVSKNPLISLYASKDFRRSQTQFVVFVTPVIQASASEGVEQIKARFKVRDR